MRIHFPSVAVGVAAISLILISMSQVTPGLSYTPRVEYGPHPRDMVQIIEGTPYTVPSGSIFVLTAMGTSMGGGTCLLQINGQTTELLTWVGNGSSMGMQTVPTGFTVQAGSTISLLTAGQSQTLTGRAWGYLSK